MNVEIMSYNNNNEVDSNETDNNEIDYLGFLVVCMQFPVLYNKMV